MYKRLSAVLTTGSVALTMILAATSPSAAATTTTWTVRPGGNVIVQGSVRIKDTNTGSIVTCGSVTLTTMLKSGSGLPGAGVGSITKATFKCAITTGETTLTVHGLPWTLNALSYNSASGVTRGSLAGIHLHGSPHLAGCILTLDGTAAHANDGKVKFTYTNSTGKLSFVPTGGNLHFYKVICFGLFNSGDPAVMTGTLTVSPKQEITSP